MKKCAPVKKNVGSKSKWQFRQLIHSMVYISMIMDRVSKIIYDWRFIKQQCIIFGTEKIFKFDISKQKHENWNEVGQDHDLVLQHIYCCSNLSKYKYWLNKSRTRRRKIVYEKKVRMAKLKEEHLKNTWFYRLHFMHSVKKLSLDVLLGVAFHHWIYGAHADCLYGII